MSRSRSRSQEKSINIEYLTFKKIEEDVEDKALAQDLDQSSEKVPKKEKDLIPNQGVKKEAFLNQDIHQNLKIRNQSEVIEVWREKTQ